MAVYREIMQFQQSVLNIRVFAAAIEKAGAQTHGWDVRQAAWQRVFERVNKFCGIQERAIIFPDEGDIGFPKRLLRRMRRFHQVSAHWGRGSLAFPVQRIVEDPSARDSADSYFVQVADWNAYAAHRSNYVDAVASTPSDLWDGLGDIRILEVNRVTGGPPGIVVYPR